MTLDDTAPMTGLLLSGHLRETPTSHCNRHSHKRPGKRDRRLNAAPSCPDQPGKQASCPLTTTLSGDETRLLPGTGLRLWPRWDLRAGHRRWPPSCPQAHEELRAGQAKAHRHQHWTPEHSGEGGVELPGRCPPGRGTLLTACLGDSKSQPFAKGRPPWRPGPRQAGLEGHVSPLDALGPLLPPPHGALRLPLRSCGSRPAAPRCAPGLHVCAFLLSPALFPFSSTEMAPVISCHLCVTHQVP